MLSPWLSESHLTLKTRWNINVPFQPQGHSKYTVCRCGTLVCHLMMIRLPTNVILMMKFVRLLRPYVNPLAAELLYETKIYISHFPSLLNIQTANVNHISHIGRPEHSWQMRKIPCLLMHWRRKEPGHHRACNLPVSPWYIMVQQREGFNLILTGGLTVDFVCKGLVFGFTSY